MEKISKDEETISLREASQALERTSRRPEIVFILTAKLFNLAEKRLSPILFQGRCVLKSEMLSDEIAIKLKTRPYFFSELLREYSEVEYRLFLESWSDLRSRFSLQRDKEGRYLL